MRLKRAGTDAEPVGGAPVRRRGRIVFALFGVFALVGLAPLASVAWKLIETSKEELKTAHLQRQLLLASTVAGEIDVYTVGLRDQMGRLSRALGATLATQRDPSEERIRALLADVTDDNLVYLRFRDFKGETIDSSAASMPPGLLDPIFEGGLRKSAEALAGARPDRIPVSVSEPVFVGAVDRRRATVVLTAPVLAGGSFRGVLSALVDLQGFWEAVAERYKNDGYVLSLIDGRGRLLASNDREGPAVGTVMGERSTLVQRFIQNPERASVTMPFVMTHEGFRERFLGSYHLTGERWGVVVHAPERAVFATVQSMIDSTLTWALGALSAALLAAIIFARTLSGPIDRLAEASRAFARGELGTRVTVRSNNEIGELAETFNGMAAELEDTIRRLKRAAEENNELFLGTARALASAIDAKDPYTRGHSVRVNRYSIILARQLGLPAADLRDIHVASLLHDVGKIGVDDHILKKPAQLTREEFEVMKLHTVIGANIMAPIRQMRRIVPGLRSHHEKWKGGGYPDGLAGDKIPFMARIIAVADSFDAMTTDRPYQRAMSFDKARDRLNELKGVAYDEHVVEAFNRAYLAGEFKPESHAARPVEAPAEAPVEAAAHA